MSQLRVTAGALRGRRIPVPRGEVRPTSERARQAYFNIVATRLPGARFLDLFAGSGIFSVEALSRGAASATAVEQSRQNAAAISALGARLEANIDVITGDVVSTLKKWSDRAPSFDLVYADPPYDYDSYDDLLQALTHGPLSKTAIVAVEHRRGTSPFKTFQPFRRAEYGEVWISFFQQPQHLQEKE